MTGEIWTIFEICPSHLPRRDLALVATGRGLSLLGDEVAVLGSSCGQRPRRGPAWPSRAGRRRRCRLVLAALMAGLLADRVPTRRLVAGISVLQSLVVLAPRRRGRVGVAAARGARGAGAQRGAGANPPGRRSCRPSRRATTFLAPVGAPDVTAAAMLPAPAVGGLLVGGLGITAARSSSTPSVPRLALVALALRVERRPQARHEKGAAWPAYASSGHAAAARDVRAARDHAARHRRGERRRGLPAHPAARRRPRRSTAPSGRCSPSVSWRRDRRTPSPGVRRSALPARRRARVDVDRARRSGCAHARRRRCCDLRGRPRQRLLNVLGQSIVVRRTPEPVLGRVFAALSALVGAG